VARVRCVSGWALLFVAFASAAAGQPTATSPSEVLMSADRLDGHRVRVNGSIANLRQDTSFFGRRSYTFDLSDGTQTIRVFASGKAPCEAGQATVEGTFQKVKLQRYITASKVTCGPQDSK
jgi:hypothetical protein